jgi:hypothetical protein
MWVTAYLSRPIWINAPIVDGLPSHPLATTFYVLSLTIGCSTPWLLLPVGAATHATVDPEGVLTVITVLGRRRVELDRPKRIGALTLSVHGPDQRFLYLRGERFHWVLLWLGTSATRRVRANLPAPLRDLIESAVDERPEVLSARARIMLRIGTCPGLRQRFALATFSFVVGMAVSGEWIVLAWTLILVGSMPIT